LAVAAALALPVEKALEVGIKNVRPVPRPVYVEPTVLRDDAPVEGESFPSGHAAIAATAACLVAPYVPAPARLSLFATAVGTGIVRISQGAHHPVDAVGGTALGVAIGAGLRLVIGW
jgi:membrane-associated phospholipid phosphatase